MSSYFKQTKHPVTGEWEDAMWMDDYFGNHNYGVEFPSNKGSFYNPEEMKLETRDAFEEPSYIGGADLKPVEGWKDQYCKKFGLCKSKGKCQCKKELAFISKLLDAQKKEIVEMIEKKIIPFSENCDGQYILDTEASYNKAIKEVIELINKLK